MTPKVACLIAARSGSTRVPGKNLQVVGGQTLLERAIRVAREAFGEVFVSTDALDYADQARAAGAIVRGLRPIDLATDTTSMDEVIQHALAEWLPHDREILVLVQPTSPFTEVPDLFGVVEALEASPQAACAMTVEAMPAHIAFALVESPDGLARLLAPDLASYRTQDLPPLYRPTGNAFAARTDRLRRGGSLISEPVAVVKVPAARAIDIDDHDDLVMARRRAERG